MSSRFLTLLRNLPVIASKSGRWGLLAFALMAASPAHASLQLCNQTSFVLYAATGSQLSTKIYTRGWTRIAPGDCATAIAEPLKAPAYFVYARSARERDGARRVWGGQFQLCAMDGEFGLQSPAAATSCKVDGAFQIPFAPIATNGAPDWSMTFTETPARATPDAARDAGLARLLGELGYAPGPNGKTLATALAQFRARQKMPASAGPAELFRVLEAEVEKANVAKGYSICNDGTSSIWAALGLKAGGDFVSRGWWEIAAGNCAVAIDNALGRDAVYLFASKHGNKNLVSGPENFCISNAEFDIRGRDRCTSRGLSVAGFLPTNLKGEPGFTAHIGDGGLAGSGQTAPK